MSKHKMDEDYIRSVIEKVLAEKQPPPPVPTGELELTPEPVRGKRRSYTRTTITVDDKLWKLVQEECDKLHILPPRLIDSLLWHYFKKPMLSYQHEDSSAPFEEQRYLAKKDD